MISELRLDNSTLNTQLKFNEKIVTSVTRVKQSSVKEIIEQNIFRFIQAIEFEDASNAIVFFDVKII